LLKKPPSHQLEAVVGHRQGLVKRKPRQLREIEASEIGGRLCRHGAKYWRFFGTVTFARWQGSDPAAPAVATGSHLDAIPNAGKYDGVVGILGGLEATRALQRARFQPKHSIELLMFTSEDRKPPALRLRWG